VSEKILVVDDQRNMRTTLALMLRGAGYEVDEAASGAQAAERALGGAYDLIITDLRMGAESATIVAPVTQTHETESWNVVPNGAKAPSCAKFATPLTVVAVSVPTS
jgi:CheY-like chemotaxis protein